MAFVGCSAAAFSVGGCADRYGRTDYLRSSVLGAGLGAGVGLLGAGIAGDQHYRRGHHGLGYDGYGYGGYGYGHPAPRYVPPIAGPSYGYGGSYGRGYGW